MIYMSLYYRFKNDMESAGQNEYSGPSGFPIPIFLVERRTYKKIRRHEEQWSSGRNLRTNSTAKKGNLAVQDTLRLPV